MNHTPCSLRIERASYIFSHTEAVSQKITAKMSSIMYERLYRQAYSVRMWTAGRQDKHTAIGLNHRSSWEQLLRGKVDIFGH